MQREDTYAVRVSVDGRDLGVWDKQTGGSPDSEDLTYRPGGLADQVSLGGAPTIGSTTVTKLYDDVTHGNVHWLASRAGKGNVVITRQPLDADGHAWGRPITWTGKLKSVNLPDVDSNSNNAALIGLEVTLNGGIS